MRHPSFKNFMARLIHFSGIFSLIFACQLNALEFDIETIAVSPKHNVDIIPFSNESSAESQVISHRNTRDQSTGKTDAGAQQ